MIDKINIFKPSPLIKIELTTPKKIKLWGSESSFERISWMKRIHKMKVEKGCPNDTILILVFTPPPTLLHYGFAKRDKNVKLLNI